MHEILIPTCLDLIDLLPCDNLELKINQNIRKLKRKLRLYKRGVTQLHLNKTRVMHHNGDACSFKSSV